MGSRAIQLETATGRLIDALHAAAHVLPAQGPITIFIHHNTLHALEHRPFERAVIEGGELLGCQPFLAEEDYRAAVESGRITARALDQVIAEELGDEAGEPLTARVTVGDLLRAMLAHGAPPARGRHLRWLLEERGVERRAGELWPACCAAMRGAASEADEAEPPARIRDLLLGRHGVDIDREVHPVLIRLCAAFLDQGVAYWPMPDRERGFYSAVAALYGDPLLPPPEPWSRRFVELLQDDAREGRDELGSLEASLEDLGIPPAEWRTFSIHTALALRGWAGMTFQIESRPDRVPVHAPPASLAGFLAVRLLLERAVLARHAGELGWGGLANLRAALLREWRPPPGPSEMERAWPLLHAAERVRLEAGDIAAICLENPTRLADLFARFPQVERRRLLHLAYEQSFYEPVLAALANRREASSPPRPRVQVVCCIDEREESLRRHLEEACPEIETLGFAGFFGVPMYFRGIDDAHPRPLCPVVVQPRHEVREVPAGELSRSTALMRAAHRHISVGARGLSVGSMTLVRGTVITALVGMLSAVPLLLQVLVPRLAELLRRSGRGVLRPRPPTRLTVARSDDPPTLGSFTGFTKQEMADIVVRVLADMGLAEPAPLVVVLGHGSTSLNNPQESAHDCGACGGGHGGANARAFALMANDPEVRALCREAGIDIPPGSWFVGGEHNSCHDGVELYDLDQVPEPLQGELGLVQRTLEVARARDAQERCRRFAATPEGISPAGALLHVEARAHDLAQPRPEYGHATAAVCVIGRRTLTRGLFFDRRAFLVSYDPEGDAGGAILARVMGAAVPVVAGIALEYYFGFVDPTGYGCGTKLPHNISALLGVMDGHQSDLRPGLPWQMVEIHEPMRLLVVVEAPRKHLARVLEADPQLGRLAHNGWIRLLCLEPGSERLYRLAAAGFVEERTARVELPRAPSSAAYFSRRRGYLPVARIGTPEVAP